MGASSSTKIPSGSASTPSVHDGNAEPDSQPLNFDTFVPTHDPSLDIPSDPTSNQIPVPDTNYIPAVDASAVVSQDEAFSRALNAMYWGGYWTAIYHVRQDYHFISQVSYTFFSQAQRQLAAQSTGSNVSSGLEVTAGTAEEEEEEEEEEDPQEIEIDGEDFISTQR